jgi:hypothetical protein
MKKSVKDPMLWHPGITMHKIPVAGIGGLLFSIGVVMIALLGIPIAKWFFAAALILGVIVAYIIRWFHQLRPQTEVEEVELNVDHNLLGR